MWAASQEHAALTANMKGDCIMNYITLKRHGVNDYFNVLGMDDKHAATIQGRFLEVDEKRPNGEWHGAGRAEISRETAANIRNGIVTKEAATEIEQALAGMRIKAKCHRYVESYFVGCKVTSVAEWQERQKNDKDIVTHNGETLDVSDWTIKAANDNSVTPSVALQYDRKYYDALLPDLAKIKPDGSFTALCWAAHFGKRNPGRGMSTLYTLDELAEIV